MTHSHQKGLARVSDRLGVNCAFVALQVRAEDRSWTTAGELRVPQSEPDARGRPAIVIIHGSSGIDSRGLTYAKALNKQGFVTLELDLWAVRGVKSPADRPRAVSDTLPDAFAALTHLAARADIDQQRIGIMGFSWGGVVSMLSATRAYADALAPDDVRFAAHAPLYPVCWLYNTAPGYGFTDLTGAPVFIQAGADDRYDPQGAPKALARGDLVRVCVYEGATHAWDRAEPDMVVNDPSAHPSSGGVIPFTFNAQVAARSVAATVDFFRQHMA